MAKKTFNLTGINETPAGTAEAAAVLLATDQRETKTRRVQLILPQSLYDKAAEQAHSEYLSLNSFVQKTIEEYLKG